MSEPVKVTDARLTECLAKLGGECPFCGNTDPECRDREETGESVLYIYDCPKCDRHWTEIYDLTSIAVDADDAAEGETGYSKGPVLPPLDVHELVYRDGILDIKASHPLFVLFATECAKMLNELKAEPRRETLAIVAAQLTQAQATLHAPNPTARRSRSTSQGPDSSQERSGCSRRIRRPGQIPPPAFVILPTEVDAC